MSPREAPATRLQVLGWLAAALLAVVLAGTGLATLRPPDQLGDALALDADPGDPRLGVDCPQPVPREGLPRGEEVGDTVEAPVAVTSGELLTCPQTYDGLRVLLRGEVVGQPLGRGERAWLQVNDDVYATEVGPLPEHRYYRGGNAGIGVSVPRAQLGQLVRWGGPGTAGDQVEVRGIFHRVDPASGEIAIIAGEQLDVVAQGRLLERRALTDRRVVAYVLSLLAAAITILQRRRARG